MSKILELYTFDPKAFCGDGTYSQEICDVVLCAALLYNDIKNTIVIINLLHASRPTGEMSYTREWGEYTGRDMHIFRHHVGILHELFQFMESNIETINTRLFQEIISQMSLKARDAWGSLVEASISIKPVGSFGNLLVRMRNQVSFHYDSRQIGIGFRKHFFKKNKVSEQAFVSKGISMEETRFYFADAAVQDYINLLLGNDNEAFQNEIKNFMNEISFSFYQLIDRFIIKRGFAYQIYRHN